MRAERAAFIFDWRRGGWDLRLPVLLLVSLLGHLLCFYAFHIVYPSTTALLPAAATVTVLNPRVESDRRLLEWADLEDPSAMAAPGFRPELIARLVPRYEPADLGTMPRFADLTPAVREGLPPVFGPDGVLTNRPAPAAAPPVAFASRLELGSALPAPLGATALPPLPRALVYAEPTVLFLSVDAAGGVALCLPWRSSGDANLDGAAERYARALRFAPPPHPVSGEVRFVWGYDAS